MTRHLARAAVALLCACPAVFAAQGTQEIETEVALESAQEARLQTVLRKVLASEDVLVIVDMDLVTDSRPRLSELLPGVPLKDTPVAADMAPLVRSSVKALSATVILDDSLSADADTPAQKIAEQVLSMDLGRGDAVTVKRMRLRGQLAAARAPAREWMMPAPLVSLLWLGAALAALGLLYGRFLNPLLGVLREIGAARSAPPPASPAGGMIEPATDKMPPLSASLGAPETVPAAAADGEELPFSFLRERHAPMLKFLLRRAPARTAAVIVHYLPARVAVDVLGELPAETRREVAKAMSKVVQLDEENVRQIEDSLRARIDYLMGGEDKLAEILDQAPPALQEEMLAAVRGEEPDVAIRLGRRIVRLEDVAALDANDLKTLSRRVPIRSLASVFSNSPEMKAQILPKLGAGLGAWLTQEIELAGVMSGDRLQTEQRKVLAVLTQLVREGAVKLHRPDDPMAAALAHEAAPPAPLQEG
ncbi:MAG: hypothetical protein HYZ75_18750 [Elusimicrobia bacterium]|nr:hypothetical protein [Elusimicrobiota bacterium]